MAVLPLVESKLFASALKVAGPAFFLSMQATSVKTALSIIADKSVKSLSPLPFISLLTNCLIWSFYGLLRKDNTVLIPNAAGILSGAFCVSAYHRFSTKPATQMYLVAGLIMAFSGFCAAAGNYQLLGSLGCALAVFLMGSPLAVLKTVIQEKSTAALPFGTSFAGWCNALSWSSYGLLLAHDPMIYGPNLVGLALASIQLLLFIVYGFPKQTVSNTKGAF